MVPMGKRRRVSMVTIAKERTQMNQGKGLPNSIYKSLVSRWARTDFSSNLCIAIQDMVQKNRQIQRQGMVAMD